MKNSTLLLALYVAIALLLACTVQSRIEPLGRRLSQAESDASASGSGDSVTTSTMTSGSSDMPTVSDTGSGGSGSSDMPTVADTTTTTTTTPPPGGTPTWPMTNNWPCVWPWCKFSHPPPHPNPNPPPQHPPPQPTPPPPHKPPPHHRPPPPRRRHHIPIRRHKEVKIIIVPPKPVPQIPICKGKIKEACCDNKDYCPWNWWYYPDKEPPKICKVEVEVVKEFKLCQWPVLVWKDEFDFTCKCPETPKPCDYCDSCYEDSSSGGYASSSADAYASSGGSGYAG